MWLRSSVTAQFTVWSWVTNCDCPNLRKLTKWPDWSIRPWKKVLLDFQRDLSTGLAVSQRLSTLCHSAKLPLAITAFMPLTFVTVIDFMTWVLERQLQRLVRQGPGFRYHIYNRNTVPRLMRWNIPWKLSVQPVGTVLNWHSM